MLHYALWRYTGRIKPYIHQILVILYAQWNTRTKMWNCVAFCMLPTACQIPTSTLYNTTDTYADVEESAFLVVLKKGLVHYPYQPKNEMDCMTNLMVSKIQTDFYFT